MKKIRVLVIDDSSLVRKLLTEVLESDPKIEVVGTAADPYIARDKIKKLDPDVLTLDIEMPKMDGITFLSNLMKLRPMPVVMVSTLTHKGADVALQALELGAVDYVSKPTTDLANQIESYTEEITGKVKMAAAANIKALSRETVRKKVVTIENITTMKIDPKLSTDAVLQKRVVKTFKTTDMIIAIGASTGGTEAIKEVLMSMPADSPGIVISQHIPEAFSASFAERMNTLSAMTVCEARDRQQIIAGHVFIAPGNKHLLVERDGARYICKLNDGLEVNRHKPSVDVMFRSVAQNVGPNAIGVMLTGMGDDGAKGMKEMHDQGAKTVAQDEKTSVVWGMPGEAVKQGAVDSVLPLGTIAGKIVSLSRSTS